MNIEQGTGFGAIKDGLYKGIDFSKLLPVQLATFAELRTPQNAGNSDDYSNITQTVQREAANFTKDRTSKDGLSINATLTGQLVFETVFNPRTGKEIADIHQVRRKVNIYIPQQVNRILHTLLPVAFRMQTPTVPNPESLDPVARSTHVKRAYDGLPPGGKTAELNGYRLLEHAYNSRTIAKCFKFLGVLTSTQIDNNNMTISVGGRDWEARNVFPGENATMPQSILGWIVTRAKPAWSQAAPFFQDYDTPYQLYAWSSRGMARLPTAQEMACYDYFGNYDPGFFIPCGRSAMPSMDKDKLADFSEDFARLIADGTKQLHEDAAMSARINTLNSFHVILNPQMGMIP